MINKKNNLKTINLISDFVESQKRSFQKNRLISLSLVITFHLCLVSIIVASSIWKIQYIEEPIFINKKIDDTIPIWLFSFKSGIGGSEKLNNIRKKIDIEPPLQLNYDIGSQLTYLTKYADNSSQESLIDLNFGGNNIPDILPDKPLNFAIQEPIDIKKEPVWITKGEQPKVIYRIQPEYPEIARAAHLEGEVILEAVINEIGVVESVKIINSTNNLFNESAINAVLKWKFEPGKINNKPVKAYFILTVKFKLTKT